MTEEGGTSLSPKQTVSDEDPIGALIGGVTASIAFWASWRVITFFDHRPALMIWVAGVSLAVGGLVYCMRRAKPYFIRRAGGERKRLFLRDSWRVMWTESYAPDGHIWVRAAWTCGTLAAVLWSAVGLLSP
jgi:hypothetical protein